MRKRTVLTGVVAALTVAGCGGSSTKPANPNAPEVNPAGDIPDNQVYVPFTPAGAHFSVKVPEGWSRIQSGGAITFTDKLNAIRIESAHSSAALTTAQAKSQLPQLAHSVRGFQNGKVTVVARKPGQAVLIT
jgi:hypothetical protein